MSAMQALPTGSVSILACRDTLAAVLVTRIAGMVPMAAHEALREAAPQGVRVLAWESIPPIATPLAASSIPALHEDAMRRAWRSGAWDLAVWLYRAPHGAESNIIPRIDFAEAEGAAGPLMLAATVGRLAEWTWRPMHGGPPLRAKAHAHKDQTLLPDLSRAGEPPDHTPPFWDWRGTRQWAYRLGSRPAAAASRPRQATLRQRACIIALELRAGRRPDVPARLSFAAASAWIDRLKGQS